MLPQAVSFDLPFVGGFMPAAAGFFGSSEWECGAVLLYHWMRLDGKIELDVKVEFQARKDRRLPEELRAA